MAEKPSKLSLKKAAIQACEDGKGHVTPESVVEAAKDPANILHGEFEWNLEQAAHKHWLDTARKLIREVKLTFVFEDVSLVAPHYITDPGSDLPRYIETTRVAKKHTMAKRALSDELARVVGAIRRATSLSAAFNLTSNFERMLALAIETERLFAERGDGDDDGPRPTA